MGINGRIVWNDMCVSLVIQIFIISFICMGGSIRAIVDASIIIAVITCTLLVGFFEAFLIRCIGLIRRRQFIFHGTIVGMLSLFT